MPAIRQQRILRSNPSTQPAEQRARMLSYHEHLVIGPNRQHSKVDKQPIVVGYDGSN